jgi:mRNA interferase ChpB
VPERGDVLLIDLEPTRGHEQQGKRPVLVLSVAEFNRIGLVLGCPITQGGQFARTSGFAVSLSGAGTQTQGVVLCHQARTIDYKIRAGRWVETLPIDLVEEVLGRVRTLLD